MAEEAIIKLLSERGRRGALQSEIASLTGFSKSTISYFLSRLESEGRIVRIRSPGLGYRVWLRGFESNVKLLRIGIVRAAEYPFIFKVKSMLEDRGLGVHIMVYDDGVALMSDLVRSRIDAGFSPLITELVFYAASRGAFKIIASGVSGGGSIIVRRGLKVSDVRIAGSTMASTMDACLRAYLNEAGLSDVEVSYFDNPNDMVKALEEGRVQMLSIWEPYSSLLEARGHRRVARFTDYLGEFPCCLLAVGQVDSETIHVIIESLKEALSIRDYGPEVSKLSCLIGVNEDFLRRSLSEYTFKTEFTSRELIGYLKRVGLEMASSWISKSVRGIS